MNNPPAFPQHLVDNQGRIDCSFDFAHGSGMDLRDWFAGTMQEDDRLVKCIRAMDDTALLLFATCPGVEREEWITETKQLCGENVFAGKAEVEKVVTRLLMESAAIARVRYMQADAMLAERSKPSPTISHSTLP